jgi:hypothetical protein
VTHQGEKIQESNRALLDAVRIRRDRLYEAILAVERRLAAPAGDDAPGWAAALAGPVDSLQGVLQEHLDGTEGEEGLFEQIRDEAPQLLPAVDSLREEHEPLLDATTELAAGLTEVSDDNGVDLVRLHTLDLLRRLLEHRHRGAELLYDVYAIDVSAAD